jgi:membrane associated rhomboid family serine protease
MALQNPQRGGSTGLLGTAAIVALFVAFLWIVEFADALTGYQLDTWGISPRDPSEVPDILTAPFLHASFAHLSANTVPLFVLGVLAAFRSLGRFVAASAIIVFVSGTGVWLTAPDGTVTLGASGLVFGYFGYVLLRGFVDRRPADILIGVIVGIFYGSILWGVLPTDPAVSWQGHLFGLAGGVIAAFALRTRRPSGRIGEVR